MWCIFDFACLGVVCDPFEDSTELPEPVMTGIAAMQYSTSTFGPEVSSIDNAINLLLPPTRLETLHNQLSKMALTTSKPAPNGVRMSQMKTKLPNGGIASANKDNLVPSDLAEVERHSEKGAVRTDLAVIFDGETGNDDLSRRLAGSTVSNTEYMLGDMVDTDGGDDPVRQPRRRELQQGERSRCGMLSHPIWLGWW